MSNTHDASDHDYDRLSRYLAGECTPAEKTEIDAWLAEDPARRKLLASLTTAWETAGRPRGHQTTNVDAAWTKMSASIDRAQQPRPLWTARPWRIAAAIILVAGAAVAGRLFSTRAAAEPIVYVTRVGERETIGIADGSSVVLGPASRLTVSRDYGRSAREVTLEGEALFTVQHDASKPFRVLLSGGVVEDLGTEFAVRAYAPGDTIRVVVKEGTVMFRRSTAETDTLAIVQAGEVGLLPPSGEAVVGRVSDAGALLAWSNGALVFDDAPMNRVAEELRRWYDVDVVVDNALANRHVSADFAGEPIDDVARVIATTIGARVERQGRTLTFRAASPAK